MSRDNWERLVAAVLKREQIWQLCHEDSRSPSVSTISSDFSGQILSFSSNSLEPISVSPPPQIPLSKPSVSQVSKNATRPFTQKLFAAWYRRRKAKGKYFNDFPGEEDLGLHLGRVRIFSLHELQVATENFRDKNVLEYGYNMVYKGWLSDGSPVAVKRHKDRGGQGAEVQFLTEVEINSFASHPNLLHMLGFCIASNERLTVYPLLANGSVASYLRGRNESQPPLNWSVRKKIAWGAARGLAFLHDKCVPPVIHRDVKAANIYLDGDFEAVVGDFDLAIIMGYNVTEASETCSEKTDVYGYGTFLLELVAGLRAFELAGLASEDGMILLDWIRRNLEERKWEMMADPYCGGNHMEEVVEQLTKIALLCTQSTPWRRPKMSEIVRMLEVGDALAERWEECSKEEMICQKDLGIHLRRVRRFSLHELQVATGNFSDKINPEYAHPEYAQNVVFKGWLADGFPVAVKRHKARYDRTAEQQSLKEVDIGRITAHPNVLHVLGFCIAPKDQLVVYPFMVNGSVKSRLRDRHDSQAPLAWPIRKGIALGAARGLAYLHEECFHKIIHRDVKAANILLNEDFEAVIADFELAIIMDHDDTVFEDTVCGTLGHIAPEYLSTGRCSEKTDVFGYGMFLLELITGQRAYDLARLANDEDMMLLDWVRRNYEEIKWEMMVDSDLEGNYINEEVEQLMQTALLCTQNHPDTRPKMSEIVRMLEVGDGLAERWDKCYKKELDKENDSSELEKKNDSSYYITVDDTSIILEDELSGPR